MRVFQPLLLLSIGCGSLCLAQDSSNNVQGQPTTQAATQPSLSDLKGHALLARSNLEAAQEASREQYHKTPQYLAAAQDEESKRLAREKARDGGAPQELLDASSAWIAAKQHLDDLNKQPPPDPKVNAAQKEYEDALAAVKRQEQEQEQKQKDVEAAAVKAANTFPPLQKPDFVTAHDIKIGMNEAEVRAIMQQATDYAIYSLKQSDREDSTFDVGATLRLEARIKFHPAEETKQESGVERAVRYRATTIEMETDAAELRLSGNQFLADLVLGEAKFLNRLGPDVLVTYQDGKVVRLEFPDQ